MGQGWGCLGRGEGGREKSTSASGLPAWRTLLLVEES